jgi:heme/copper-type cytochrome/quinol oxidase subunit 2
MKIKIFLASLILLLSNRSMAAAATFNYGDFDTLYIKVMSVIIFILILIVVGLLYLTLVAMKKMNKPASAQEEKRTAVEKLFSLHSLKHEKECNCYYLWIMVSCWKW